MSEIRKGNWRAGAVFSGDEAYRYSLWRTWSKDGPRLLWLMLNPSTADEKALDPTLVRCQNYAKQWGFGGMLVGNLYALRSPDPSSLRRHPEPVGSETDAYLQRMAAVADWVMVGWGAHGKIERAVAVLPFLGDHPLLCLGTTKSGHPRHPLYLRKDQPPEVWKGDPRLLVGA